MKITRVDAFAIGIGDVGETEYLVNDDFRYSIYGTRHQTVIARVETDAGVIGYGEGQSPISPETTKTIVETALRPILLGRDPLDSSALWYRMYSAMRERGHQTGFYPDALAAVDIALWDIKGKATGLPVYKLLGGAFRDRVPVYNGVSATTPAEAAAEAKSHAEAGYGGVKLHIRGSVPETAEVAQAVRDAVGPEVKIMVDVHTYHSVSSAIALGRRLEAIDATWLESPLVPEDIGGLVRAFAGVGRSSGVERVDAHALGPARGVRATGLRHRHARYRPDGSHGRHGDCDSCGHVQHPGCPAHRRRWHRLDRRIDPLLSGNPELLHHGA